MAITVSIVDDDKGIRASIANLVSRAKTFELLGEYAEAESAIKGISTNVPDVVLMDINMPGMSGVECVRQLKPIVPRTQFLMLTVYEDTETLFDSLRAGASGHLLKRSAPTRLIESIHEIYAGGLPITPQLARRLLQFFSSSSKNSQDAQGSQLTSEEREYLACLSNGFTCTEIAQCMRTSIENGRSHIRTVYEKFHLHICTEAVANHLPARSAR